MYVILAYDVDEKRCKKYYRACSRYLLHTQNSLFEGVITNSKLDMLIVELKSLVVDSDRIVIYKLSSNRSFIRADIGALREQILIS